MPDTKITALTAIGANPIIPATFPIPMVDLTDTSMAASGTTKKVTVNQILGAGGTATLASATITGDLTVRTNKLFVNATGVGVGTTNILSDFVVQNGSNSRFEIVSQAGGIVIENFNNARNAYLNMTMFADAYIWNRLGSEAMRLNSTGLGVGASPNFKLDVAGAANSAPITLLRLNNTGTTGGGPGIAARLQFNAGATALGFVQGSNFASGSIGVQISGDGTNIHQTIDSSGNVGIGVTPSAWTAGFRVIQASTGVAISTNGVVDRCDISANYYFNSGNKFLNATGRASNFSQDGGAFYFYQSTAASGGVGSAITWGPGMTLDASGNLLVGTTSQNGSWNTKLTISNDSGTTKWAVGPYLGGVTNFLISAGASAGVYLNGTAATSWTSASDERLKDIIEPISNAVSKVASLRAVIGKFKFDENNTRKPFLIAQDIQAVLPEAVDASNPDKLGVAYTDVIPLIVAAIKELTARVQTLEAK